MMTLRALQGRRGPRGGETHAEDILMTKGVRNATNRTKTMHKHRTCAHKLGDDVPAWLHDHAPCSADFGRWSRDLCVLLLQELLH